MPVGPAAKRPNPTAPATARLADGSTRPTNEFGPGKLNELDLRRGFPKDPRTRRILTLLEQQPVRTVKTLPRPSDSAALGWNTYSKLTLVPG